MTRTATYLCRSCRAGGWREFMVEHHRATGHEFYEQRSHRTPIGDRPKVGDPVWVPGICSELPDEWFDDDREWPTVKSIVRNVRGPAGYFLVWLGHPKSRLTLGRANVWIERMTDPNGERAYWHCDETEVGRLGLGMRRRTQHAATR